MINSPTNSPARRAPGLWHDQAPADGAWTISLRRELAHAFFYEKKKIIVRGGLAPQRLKGRFIWIHAAKKGIDKETRQVWSSYLAEDFPDISELPYGVILGKARLVGAFRAHGVDNADQVIQKASKSPDVRWGDWLNNNYLPAGPCQIVDKNDICWIFDDHTPLLKPRHVGAGTGGLYDYRVVQKNRLAAEKQVA